jgi:hypothetical protein
MPTTISTVSDSATSRKIQAIRLAAGNPGTHCPCCTRPVADPYRRIVDGRCTEGCVDASHAGHFGYSSTSSQWHNRPAAREIRKAELARLGR